MKMRIMTTTITPTTPCHEVIMAPKLSSMDPELEDMEPKELFLAGAEPKEAIETFLEVFIPNGWYDFKGDAPGTT